MSIWKKIATVLWVVYMAFYVWGWYGAVMDWGYSWQALIGSLGRIMVLAGMIGYVVRRKVAYRIIWEIFFWLFSVALISGMLTALGMDLGRWWLVQLLSLLPAGYALHDYAYRSRDIWEKQ